MDVLKCLDHFNIPYSTSGKNVAYGWVGMNCCFCDDHSNHLGINLDSGGYKCWICDASGFYYKIIKTLFPTVTFKQFVDQSGGLNLQEGSSHRRVLGEDDFSVKVRIPRGVRLHHSEEAVRYLTEFSGVNPRRFSFEDVRYLGENFGLFYCNESNHPLVNRIFIPVKILDRVVTAQGRAVLEDPIRYKSLPDNLSSMRLSDCLYGFDHAANANNPNILLVQEGPFDSLKVNVQSHITGVYSVSLFTKNITSSILRSGLLLMLIDYFKRTIILTDKGTSTSAKKIRAAIDSNKISIVSMKDKPDTGSLTAYEVISMCEEFYKTTGESRPWNLILP